MSLLEYPFADVPVFGSTLEVAPGVRWLRMPLPMALDHINLYLLEDDEGWWIVDTGMKWGEVQRYWQTIFDHELGGKPVIGVFVTHMHPDHIGQAGWICDRFKIPLHISFGEYFSACTLSKITADDLDWSTEQYFRRVGFDDDFFIQMKSNFHGFGSVVEKIPSTFIRMEEGSEYCIAGRQWRVVIGRGHSPEHACLYCEALGVMLSGDQIIPKITSNVGVMPSEPEANPLAQWFDSLRRFMEFPEDTLLLPAHNTPFRGLQSRLKYLISHHQDHLLALEEACADNKTAAELMPILFKRKLDSSQIQMAIGECVAHLNFLLQEKRLTRTIDHRGVYQYRVIDQVLANSARLESHPNDVPLDV